ncbi:MAG: nucleoside/nucleotide kinase family protein [Actinomycetota bacterium]
MTRSPRTVDPPRVDLDGLADRIAVLRHSGRRCLVGLAGPPGAGKSTVAGALAGRLGGATVVPMDGFHLAQSVLDAAGIADRKGAPHTFDAAGFVALVRRLRAADEVVYAPRFDRHLEEPIANAIAVTPDDDVVIVEGNYLLLDEPPWSAARALFDLVAHLDLDPEVRLARLVARHVVHGRTPDEAQRWIERNDARNARLVERGRGRADVILAAGSVAAPH